jgi:2-isopropylmalate synthase
MIKMVEILDSTLREGEQTSGVTFTIDEKLIIADLLDEFKIDIIEAGHPCVSEDVYTSIKKISHQDYNAEILAHCRALKKDVDLAIACDVDWVGVFLCVSNDRLKYQFRTTLENVIEKIAKTVEYAKDHGLKVRYTPEDSIRTDYNSLITACKAAVGAGADRISIADTVGAITPLRMYKLIRKIKSDLNVELNVHCHNDLGLATANALAAYEAGASLIDVTINGIGERTGIASLSEICLALHSIYKIENSWNLKIIPILSQKVADFSGIKIPRIAPIVGENAFIHNAGLHVAAVLNNPMFYELFPPELIGKKRSFILDKMASINTVKKKIEEVGYSICKENVTRILNHAKSKEKGFFSDEELIGLLSNNESDNIMFQ